MKKKTKEKIKNAIIAISVSALLLVIVFLVLNGLYQFAMELTH